MHCACANRPDFHFRSKIWRNHRIPRPRFPLRREKFGDSHTFKADIGSLNICMGFRTFWPKMGGLWSKIGEGVVWYWPSTNSFFLLGVLRLCQFWWKSIKKCDRESARRRTDTLTHWQTQTDFIVCPMLYAIAMGQIIKSRHRLLTTEYGRRYRN